MELYENMRCEPVGMLALREPVALPITATVKDAIQAMREKKLGCAIIVDENRIPLGMFTESELTRLLSEESLVWDEPVTRYLTRDWPAVTITDPISAVLDALETKNIRFLIVVDDQGKVVGLTGQKGLMEYVAEHFLQQVSVQRIGGNPYPVEREGA